MNLNLSVLDGLEEVDSIDSLSKDPVVIQKKEPPVDDKNDKDDKKNEDLEVQDYQDLRNPKEIDSINSINGDEDPNEDPDDAPNDSIKEVFKLTAGLVKEKGFIDFEEKDLEEVEDAEAFLSDKLIEKFNNDLTAQIEEYKGARDPRVRRILELEDEGYDIEKILEAEAKIQNLEKIDSSKIKDDEDLAEKVHTQYLKRQGMDTDEIKEEIETLKLDGKLADRASKSYPKLKQLLEKEAIQIEKQEKANKEEAVRKYQDTLKNVETYFTKTEKILDIPVTEQERKKLFKMYSEVGKDGQTELQRIRAKDPLQFDATVAFLASNNFDLSKIKTNIKNTVLKEVKSKVTVNKEPAIGKIDYNKLKKALNIK